MIEIIKKKLNGLFLDKKFSEILSGSVWALSARVVATVLGLATSVIVARFFGAEVVGIIAVINSFLLLVTIFTVLGTGTSILRLIPEHLAKYSPTSAFKIYRKTQYLVVGISVVMSIVFFLSSNLIADKIFSKPHLSNYFALASVFVVFKSMTLLNTNAVRGLRLIKLFAIMQFLPQAFNLLFLIAIGFVWDSQDIPVYAALFGFSMSGIIGWFIMEYAFKKKVAPNDVIHVISYSNILSISLPMLMTSTMMFLIAETGVLMIGVFRSETEVGYYAIAVKLAFLTTFVLQAVNSMAAPKFSELFFTDKMNELFHVAKKSTKLIIATTAPIMLCSLVFGKFILSIVFGHEFVVAYTALVLLIIGQFVNSISGATGMFMNMTGYQKVLRNIMCVAAAINIGLNLWLIPWLGINGAAFSAMVSLCFWNIATLVYMKRKFGRTIGYFPFLQFFSKNLLKFKK